MANHDPYQIKARLALLDMSVEMLCVKMRAAGCDVVRQSLARARRNEVKTERDWDILNSADSVLRELEKQEGGNINAASVPKFAALNK